MSENFFQESRRSLLELRQTFLTNQNSKRLLFTENFLQNCLQEIFQIPDIYFQSFIFTGLLSAA